MKTDTLGHRKMNLLRKIVGPVVPDEGQAKDDGHDFIQTG